MADILLKINNVASQLITEDTKLKNLLGDKLRFRPKNYWHSKAYKKKKWDGWKNFFNRKSGVFLTGLLPEVKAALVYLKKEYGVVDQRDSVTWATSSINQQFLNQWLPKGHDPITLHDFQSDLVNQCIKYNRGIVTAPTACHRKGQLILMYDGTVKKVEDIKIGDKLMGPDSSARTVLSLCRGKDTMYRISPLKGKPFVVNGEHVLSLVKTTSHRNRYPGDIGGQITNVKVVDWLKWSKWQKHLHKLYRSNKIEFKNKHLHSICPYFLGIMLGDGSWQITPAVTTADIEIVKEVKRQAEIRNLVVKKRKAGGKSSSYFLSCAKKGLTNPLTKEIRSMKLWGTKCGNKFVPFEYKTASIESRLKLLAGYIDTDGHLIKQRSAFETISKSKTLSNDIAFIARSVGLHASIDKCMKCDQNGTYGIYHRVYISGNIHVIPTKIKIAKPRKTRTNPLRTGFKVKKLNKEIYYGFTLDKDHLYLLDDFTVTHNSGKTYVLISLLKCLPPKTPVLFLTKNASLVHQNWEEMKKWNVPNLGRWYAHYKEPNYVMCATVHKQTFESLDNLLPKFKAILVDEVHDCMSDVPLSAYVKMEAASIRIGFSATAFKWNKKKIDDVHKWSVKGHFGPLFKTTTTESGILTTKDLQERKILAKSDCVFYPVTHPNLAYEPYQDAVKLGIEQNFHFHEMVSGLAKSCTGRTLVVVERIEQGEYLKQMIPESHFIQGNDSLKEREPIINSLKAGEKFVGIVMRQIITAGINIKIHDLINAAGGDGAHNCIQLMGRGLRTADDKDLLRYHDFHFLINDYLRKHSEWRMQVLEKEGHNVTLKEKFDLQGQHDLS